MRYFFWTGCAIIVTSIVIHIRRHNAFIQYLQEAKLNDPHASGDPKTLRVAEGSGSPRCGTEDDFNKSSEDDFIYSL